MNGEGFDIVDVLRGALERGNELSTVEFKEYVDPDNDTFHWLVRAIAAMANGESEGFVFVGVKDGGLDVVGLAESILAKFDNANVYRKLSSLLTPCPRLDVHRFAYQDKALVGIVVHPFEEIPTFVAKSFGGYSAGTILVRTPGGESAPAAKEGDLRSLCERIVERHAEKVAGHIRRYTRLAEAPATVAAGVDRPEQDALGRARALASNYWAAGKRYLEVFFAPCSRFAFDRAAFSELFPWSDVTTLHHNFPTSQVFGWHGPRLKPQGWIATIPDKPDPDSDVEPAYLWAMHVSWAFIDRDRFWEDDRGSRIVGGIGIMHLAIRVALLLRFLRRIGRRYQLDATERFLVGTRLKGVKGRFFASEYAADTDRIPRSNEDDVEVVRTIQLSVLDELPDDGVSIPAVLLDLIEEAGWRLGRTDLAAYVYTRAVQHAAVQVEPAVLFPAVEDVPIYEAREAQ